MQTLAPALLEVGVFCLVGCFLFTKKYLGSFRTSVLLSQEGTSFSQIRSFTSPGRTHFFPLFKKQHLIPTYIKTHKHIMIKGTYHHLQI